MRIIGNLLWWLFGGLEAAFGYFIGHVMKFNEQVSGAIESFPIDNLTLKSFFNSDVIKGSAISKAIQVHPIPYARHSAMTAKLPDVIMWFAW